MVPLPQVALHVHVQVALLRELASAVLADVGFDAEMFSEMNLESRLLIIGDAADETGVQARAHVNLALSDPRVLADHQALLIQVDFVTQLVYLIVPEVGQVLHACYDFEVARRIRNRGRALGLFDNGDFPL